jgi:hypothetical protein
MVCFSLEEKGMRTLKPLPEGAHENLAMELKQARTKGEFQRGQCLWDLPPFLNHFE